MQDFLHMLSLQPPLSCSTSLGSSR
jgi:hypothetical protein